MDRREIRQFLVDTYGNLCYYCGCSFTEDLITSVTFDHLIPASRGGSDDVSNLVLCCYGCNQAKANRTWWEYVQSVTYRRRAETRVRQKRPKLKMEILTSLDTAIPERL